MRIRTWWGIASLLLSTGGVCTAAAAAPQFTIGNSPSFYQGSFGTGSTMDIFYDPTYFQYKNRGLRVKLTIPYISVSGLPQGTLLTPGGVARRTSGQQTTSASGLGDIWLAAHYTVYRGRSLVPTIRPYAKIKFGTASYSKGLGTGRNDYEFGVGVQDTVGTRIFPFAHLGYRFVGKRAGLNLQNIWTYDVGATYSVDTRNFLTAMFVGSGSEEPGYAGPADVVFAWNYNVTPAGSGFQAFVDKGMTNGSPNYGIGISGQVVF